MISLTMPEFLIYWLFAIGNAKRVNFIMRPKLFRKYTIWI